ncbi:MAG: DUF2520 domain-containing protein [Chloroflexota bacterium]|jgi:predicted short-subunit dehydrogenase-like oxidoreductase (DUF2520 family)
MSPLPSLGKETPVAIVAAGRLGSSLAIAMSKAGYNVTALSSRRTEHRKWLSEQLPNSVVVESAQTAANTASVVFVTGPDAAISEIADSIDLRAHQAAVHCAGVLPLSVLDSIRGSGAEVAGFHPLQTFPSVDSSDQLEGVSFAIESSEENLDSWLFELAEALDGSGFHITTEGRAAYHTSAVMACGLVSGLVGLAAEMWEPLGISRSEALERLIPLIKSTADALDAKGLPGAITGPYVRGDVGTVETHLAAAAAKSPETGRAYAALAAAALHIAQEQGGLSGSVYERIKILLNTPI